jgi:F-type H+-transporting ATPase subunit a
VLVHGNVMRLKNPALAQGEIEIADYAHQDETVDGKTKTVYSAVIDGRCEPLDAKTTFDGGIMGGGITSFYDFSITRNVFTMLLTALILFLCSVAAANASRTPNPRSCTERLQNFLEPFLSRLSATM